MLSRYRNIQSERGYTLMEVLMVATIIAILMTVGTVSYIEAKRRAQEQYAAQRLSQLASYERLYYRELGSYATFDDLRDEGYIDKDYIYQNDEPQHYHRPVFVQNYTLDFIIDQNGGGFTIKAAPVLTDPLTWYARWVPLGGIPYLRSMEVNGDAVVKWSDSGRPVF